MKSLIVKIVSFGAIIAGMIVKDQFTVGLGLTGLMLVWGME